MKKIDQNLEFFLFCQTLAWAMGMEHGDYDNMLLGLYIYNIIRFFKDD